MRRRINWYEVIGVLVGIALFVFVIGKLWRR